MSEPKSAWCLDTKIKVATGQCNWVWPFSVGELWCCQLNEGHDGDHRPPNPADTLT